MILTIGGMVILAAMVLVAKRYEVRLVLFLAGLALATLAGSPMSAFKSFSEALKHTNLMEPIISCMGFTVVMQVTGCNKNLIMFLAKFVRKAGFFLIPAVMFATMFVNVSLTSTAGIAAAVGSIFIPLLMAAGVHPGMAAATVLSGTFGSFLNPGYPMNVITAQVSKVEAVAVVQHQAVYVLICAALVAATLVITSRIRKEHEGYMPPATGDAPPVVGNEDFKVNYLKALMPLLPVILIMVSAAKFIPGLKPIAISHAMIMGMIVTFAVTRESPQKITKAFFNGAGEAFGAIFGIIISAMVFVDGMSAIGLIKVMTTAMTEHTEIATLSATFGPWLLAVLCGSGEAASTAFNQAITVHAADFGLSPLNMGSMASISGAFGRAMSPVAGGVIIAAGYAGISPFEVIKRSAPGMIVACISMSAMLLFIAGK